MIKRVGLNSILLFFITALMGFSCQNSGFQLSDKALNNQLSEPPPTLNEPADPLPEEPANPSDPSDPADPTDPVTPPAPVDSKPTGGQGGGLGYRSGQCSNGREYIIYAPTGYNPQKPAPLLLAMHGLGDNFNNFANVVNQEGWKTLADKKGFLLMIPAHTNQIRKSFMHYDSNMSFNASATVAEGKSLLDCVYYGVGSYYNIETQQIYWMGFSEGATFSNYMANFLSGQIRAVAAYAGSAPRNSDIVTRRIPIYYIAGTSDYNFGPIQAQSQQWSSHPIKRDFVNAGHDLLRLDDLVSPEVVWDWLSQTPSPDPVKSEFR